MDRKAEQMGILYLRQDTRQEMETEAVAVEQIELQRDCTADRSDLAALCKGMDSSYFPNTHHLPQLKVCTCRTLRSAGRTSFVKTAFALNALWVEQQCL